MVLATAAVFFLPGAQRRLIHFNLSLLHDKDLPVGDWRATMDSA